MEPRVWLLTLADLNCFILILSVIIIYIYISCYYYWSKGTELASSDKKERQPLNDEQKVFDCAAIARKHAKLQKK